MDSNAEQNGLHPIEALWQATPEAPLAYEHPENLINPDMVNKWLSDVERTLHDYPKLGRNFSEFMDSGQLDSDALRTRYETELRFLSARDILEGLGKFGKEIAGTFSPDNTLFYLPPESDSAFLLHRTLLSIHPRLSQYGTALDSYSALRIREKNHYKGEDIAEASAFVYVDDWVLSGEHMSTFLTDRVAGKFHTFHLVVSDAAVRFFRAAAEHVDPRFAYRVKAKDPKSFYSEVPIYGAHKIPDRVPDYYASRHDWLYSIFGQHEDERFKLRGSKLIDHRGVLRETN